eukprot:CAMPEP_0172911250 /NCGR_PEP_ID=MMETSP1075-20121228/186129_1 /TAXON_ID=2916 /ORGANISM="Ceratium fusus, Strain PA161109" /LENGTH=104 /DNA_ID=CAMNT_0013769525 /DNA_START=17 /DNA_END=332 /DNA_ORIENTATION=+
MGAAVDRLPAALRTLEAARYRLLRALPILQPGQSRSSCSRHQSVAPQLGGHSCSNMQAMRRQHTCQSPGHQDDVAHTCIIHWPEHVREQIFVLLGRGVALCGHE